MHGAANGWHGAKPLHEYNVGAACGAYWSGAQDAAGIPDATMADGTPNGYATLHVARWRRIRRWPGIRRATPDDTQIALHAPKVLRQGAYPAFAVYANVFMGRDDTRVEYRIDDGDWKPMAKVLQPDPRLLAENAADDAAETLRGYDRSPEAAPSQHLWRGALADRPGRRRAHDRSARVRSLARGAAREDAVPVGASAIGAGATLSGASGSSSNAMSAKDSTRSWPCVASPRRGCG